MKLLVIFLGMITALRLLEKFKHTLIEIEKSYIAKCKSLTLDGGYVGVYFTSISTCLSYEHFYKTTLK